VKHIGIVACSAEGAALCYQTICRDALELVGKNDHPRITMDSIPLAAWMPSFDAGDYRGVARIMLDSVRLLAAAGAELAICPDNSAHLAWDDVQAETPIPWLHIGREVAAEAARRRHRRVGVLGTRFTMDGPVYRDMLAAVGIETVVPEPDDFETVDRIIFSELVDGVFTDESRKAYNEVIDRLAERGCDAVVPTEADQADVDRIIFDELIDGVFLPTSRARCIEVIEELTSRGADAVALACTEIPLLVRPDESPLPTLDSTRLLAAAALREAIA
jgi:aspartate/glutamate racemase